MNVFPYIIAVLDLGAAIVYASRGQWALAITWFLYAGACISLAKVGE